MSAAPIPVVVVDAGVGNLGNVARALRRAGGEPVVTHDPAVVAAARRLVLPGVGAFRPPREALAGPLEAALRSAVDGGAHLLGICVGYQLLFAGSDEFGWTDGLGLLAGRVERLPAGVPRPHIGWNRVTPRRPDPLFAGIADAADDWFYFVHGFAPAAAAAEETLATAWHGAVFPAASRRGTVAGVQFHPEKSGEAGLRLLRNFLAGASWS